MRVLFKGLGELVFIQMPWCFFSMLWALEFGLCENFLGDSCKICSSWNIPKFHWLEFIGFEVLNFGGHISLDFWMLCTNRLFCVLIYFYATSPIEIGNLRSTSTNIKRLRIIRILSRFHSKGLKKIQKVAFVGVGSGTWLVCLLY